MAQNGTPGRGRCGKMFFRLIVLVLIGGVALILGAQYASGQRLSSTALTREIGLQQGLLGYEGCEDTEINQWEPDRNYRGDPSFSVRAQDMKAALIRFDLTTIPEELDIPQGATITGAWLDIYALWGTPDRALSAGLYEVLRPWDIAQTTWTRANNREFWEMPGCNDPYFDRNGISFGETEIGRENTWYTFNLTYLVQKWVADPSSNYGVIIKGLSTNSAEYGFASSEHAYQTWRPKLRIRYLRPTETPSPTPTLSITPSPTPTGTVTKTPTSSPTPSPTQTPTSDTRSSYLPVLFHMDTATPTPTPSFTPTSTPEVLMYDDGEPDFGVRHFAKHWYAVRFSIAQAHQIIALGFYVKGDSGEMQITVYQDEVDPEFARYMVRTIPASYETGDWWWWPIADQDCVVGPGDFYVTFEWMDDTPDGFRLGLDTNEPYSGRNYIGPPLEMYGAGNLMIRARVSEVQP